MQDDKSSSRRQPPGGSVNKCRCADWVRTRVCMSVLRTRVRRRGSARTTRRPILPAQLARTSPPAPPCPCHWAHSSISLICGSACMPRSVGDRFPLPTCGSTRGGRVGEDTPKHPQPAAPPSGVSQWKLHGMLVVWASGGVAVHIPYMTVTLLQHDGAVSDR